MVTSSRYKLLLLDLDGTTIASRGDAMPSERVKAAVKNARKHLTISVATGRPYSDAKDIVNDLGLSGLGIFNGGAEIIQMESGIVTHRQLLSVLKMREVVKIMLPFGYTILSSADDYKESIKSPEQINIDSTNVMALNVSHQDARHMIDKLSVLDGIAAHMSTSWVSHDLFGVEVTHEKADKRHGVERLIGVLGHQKEHVIAIGDGYNDVPLLQAAGLKIVMGNAPSDIKPLADYIAPPVTEDGVAVAIEKFILG